LGCERASIGCAAKYAVWAIAWQRLFGHAWSEATDAATEQGGLPEIEAQLVEAAPDTGTPAIKNRSKPEQRKSLGTVWVVCSYPVIARGLEEALKERGRVHIGPEPPERETPAAVIFCLDEAVKDVASEVKRLQRMAPYAPILVFGLEVEQRAARTAFRVGALGYIHAGMAPAQISEAVSLASIGEVVVPKEVFMSWMAEEASTDASSLTSRKREILALVAEGLTNAEIGQQLDLSEHTVKQHLSGVYKFLKVKNRKEAVRLWSGLEDPTDFPGA
jgi:DNA-binding NarL/FixJ family response regulator